MKTLNAIPADTSREAFLVQVEIYRRMSPERRLQIALDMSGSLREMMAAGVRQRHPEFSEEEVKLAVIRLSLGEKLFREAYPHVKLPL